MAYGLQQHSRAQAAAQQPDDAQPSGWANAQPSSTAEADAGVRPGVNVRIAVGTEGAPGKCSAQMLLTGYIWLVHGSRILSPTLFLL